MMSPFGLVRSFPSTGKKKIKEEKSNKIPMLTITFDDGFQSDYDVFKIMQKRGMKGTSFCVSSYLSEENDEDPSFLKPSQVFEMATSGWEIGCHTYSHPLRNPTMPEKSKEEQINELYNNKVALEEITKKPVLTHGYVGGQIDDDLKNLMGAFYIGARRSSVGDNVGAIKYEEYSNVYSCPTRWMDFESQTVNSIKNRIDDLVNQEPMFLVLSHHALRDSSISYEDGNGAFSLEEFEDILDYIKNYKMNNKLDVVTFAEGIKRIL